MQLFKTLAASAAIAAITAPAFAGGLGDQIMEVPAISDDDAIVAAGPSIDPAFIIIGILGLFLLGASSSGGSDTTETTDDDSTAPDDSTVPDDSTDLNDGPPLQCDPVCIVQDPPTVD